MKKKDMFEEDELNASQWQRRVLGERGVTPKGAINPDEGLGSWGIGLPREQSARYVNPDILLARDLANNPTPLPPSAREGFARIYQLGVRSGASLDAPLDLRQFGLLFPATESEYQAQLGAIPDPYLRSLAGALREVNPQALPTTFGGLKQALMGSYYAPALQYASSLKNARTYAGDVVGNIMQDFDEIVAAWDPKEGGFFGFMQNRMNASARSAMRGRDEIPAIPLSVFDGPQNGTEEELFAFQQSGVDDMSDVLGLLNNSIKGVNGALTERIDSALQAYYTEVMGAAPAGENWKQDLRREVIRRGYEGGYGMDELVSGLENVEPPAQAPWYRELARQIHSGPPLPTTLFVPKGESLLVPNEVGLTINPSATTDKPLVQGLLRRPRDVQNAVNVIMQYRGVPQLPEDVRLLDHSLRKAWLYRTNEAVMNAGPGEVEGLLAQEMRSPSNFQQGWRQQLVGLVRTEDVRLSRTGKPVKGNFSGIPVGFLVPNVQSEEGGPFRPQAVITRGQDGRLRVNPEMQVEDTYERGYVTSRELEMYGNTVELTRELHREAKAFAGDDPNFAKELHEDADKLLDPKLAAELRRGLKPAQVGLAGKETVGGNVLGNMGVFENAIAHGKYDREPRQYTFEEIRAMRAEALKGVRDPVAVEMIERRYNNMMKAAGGMKVWGIDDVPEEAITDADLAKLQELHAKEVERVSRMSPLDRVAHAIERNTGTAQVGRGAPREREAEEWLGANKPKSKPHPVDMGRPRDEYEERDIAWNNLEKPTTYAADDRGSLVLEPQAAPPNGLPQTTHLEQLRALGRPLSVEEIKAARIRDAKGLPVYGPAEPVRRDPGTYTPEDQAISETINKLTEWDPSAAMDVAAARTVISRGVLTPGWIARWQGRRKDLAPGQTAQFNAGRDAVNQYNNSLNARLNAVEVGPLDPHLKGYTKDLITRDFVARQKRVSNAMGGDWETNIPVPEGRSISRNNYNPPPPEDIPGWWDAVTNGGQRAQVNETIDQPAAPQTARKVSDAGNDEVLSDEQMLAEYGAPPEEEGWRVEEAGSTAPPEQPAAAPEPEKRNMRKAATGSTVARVDDFDAALRKAERASQGLIDEFPDFIRGHFGRGPENKDRFQAWREGLEPGRKERFETLWKDLHAERPLAKKEKKQSVYTRMVDAYGWKGDPEYVPDQGKTDAFLSGLASSPAEDAPSSEPADGVDPQVNIERQRHIAEQVRRDPGLLEASTIWTPEEEAAARQMRRQVSDDPMTAWRQQPRGSGGNRSLPPGGGPPSSPPGDPIKRARQVMMSNKAFVAGAAHGIIGDDNVREFAASQGEAFQRAYETLSTEMWDALKHGRPTVFSGMMSEIRSNRSFLARPEATNRIPRSVRMTADAREFAADARSQVLGGVPPVWTQPGDTYAFEMEAEDLNREIDEQTNQGVLPETGKMRMRRLDVARNMAAGIRARDIFRDKSHTLYGDYKEGPNQWVDPSTGEVAISSDMMDQGAMMYHGAVGAALRQPLSPGLSNKEIAATIHERMGEILRASLDQYEKEVARTEPDKARVAELRKKMDMITRTFSLEADEALEAAFGAGGFKDINYSAKRAFGKSLEGYMSSPLVAAKVEEMGGFEAVAGGPRQLIQAGELALAVGAEAQPRSSFAQKAGHLGTIYGTTLGHLMMAQFMGSMAWQQTGGSVLQSAAQYGMSQYAYAGMANYGEGDPTGAALYASRQELAAERFGEQAYAQYGMFSELGYVASSLPGGAGQFAMRGVNDLKVAGGLGLIAGVGTWGLGSLMSGAGATMSALGLASGAAVTAAAGTVAAAAAPVGLAVGATALTAFGSMNLYNSLTGQDPYEGASVKNWLAGQVLGLAEAGRDPLGHLLSGGPVNPVRGLIFGDASYQDDYIRRYYGTTVEDYVKSSPIAKLIGEKNVEWLYEDRDPQTVRLKKLVDSLSDDTGFKPDEIAGSIKAIQMAFGGIETERDGLAAKYFVRQMADQGLSVEAGLSAVDQLANMRGIVAGTEDFQNLALQYAAIPSAAEKQKFIMKAGRDYQRYAQWTPYLEGGTAEAYGLYEGLGGANMAQTQAIQSVLSQAQMLGVGLTPAMATSLATTVSGFKPWQALDITRMASSMTEMGAGSFAGTLTGLGSALQAQPFGFDGSNIVSDAGNRIDTLNFIKGVTSGNQYALADYGRMAGIGVLQMLDEQGLQSGLKDMTGFLAFASQDILKDPWSTGAQTLAGLGMKFAHTSQTALLEGGLWGYQQEYVDQTNALQGQGLGLQFTQLANQRGFMYRSWGIEDQMTSAQWQSTLAGFEWQDLMLDTNRRFRLEDAELQRRQRGISNENSTWMRDFDYQTTLMRRDWAREDYQFSTQMRQLNFGWNMEDVNEQIRRSSGYERAMLIRQRDRMTLSENLQSGQAEKQFERQEELWAREDERYQKGVEFQEQMIDLDTERFELNQRQAEEMYVLQKDRLQEELASAAGLHELRLEMEALQRRHQEEQLRHQEQSLGIQKQMMEMQNEYANNMTIVSHTQAEWEATLRKITGYSPAFSRMLGEFLSFLEEASHVQIPTSGGSVTYR
jgi:hypothetical protein